eukprot:TRINITY_DN2647_c0_g1_i1.p1 TRINITY_DN2647_c0_g1~~TRINITY_DN2647_c0_g1_i1.p1  ORF type:complete len:321 (+),score=95.97 TRINITY_DN2647_c0_g1_i1:80-1042(+)
MSRAAAGPAATSRAPPEPIPEQGPLERVEVDALVILQIMKHCRQQAPSPVTGQLLGLDVDGVLQVTHSFGYVQKESEDGERVQDDGEQYQIDMMRHLREVNVDCNTVGWYQTTHLGQFFSDTVIETQYLYQTQIPRSILLVYDPLQSRIGKPAFKALRLTDEFLAKYTEAKELHKAVMDNSFSSSQMFEELPISVHSSVIIESFLVDWAIMDPMCTSQIDSLDVENQVFMEKNVQLLINSLQDLSEEQQKIMNWERQMGRLQDGKGVGKGFRRQMHPPKQLDTMILSRQIQNYCKQINNSAGDAFGKVYLLSNKPGGFAN